MIQLTLQEIISLEPVMNSLMELKFKGTFAFQIGRMAREIAKEFILAEQMREKIVNKYAQRDEEGNYIFIDEKTIKVNEIEKCNEELQSLLNTTVEINAEKISTEAFENIELSPIQIYILESIIK